MITREEYATQAAILAKPIDFEDLAARGLLRKEGARYRFTDIHALPKHVRAKMTEIHVEPGIPGGWAKIVELSKEQIKHLERLKK
jgi:hypothetical protein